MNENNEVPKPKQKRGPRKQKPAKVKTKAYCNPWLGKTEKQIAVWKEAISQGRKGNRGRPLGLPDGIGKEAFAIHKAQVDAEAVIIMRKIVEDNELDSVEDRYAIEALDTAVKIMRTQGDARNKLGAAKLILEYTKAKPSTKSDLTVHTAEDFLAQVLKDEQG